VATLWIVGHDENCVACALYYNEEAVLYVI